MGAREDIPQLSERRSTDSKADLLAYQDYPSSEGMPTAEDAVEERRGPAPEEPSPPDDVALCLSGGGLRAALFHLGAIRRLAETGALARISFVSSVSGGSIFAAFLMERLHPWPDGPIDDFGERVAEPFRAVASANLRRCLLPGLFLGRSFVESMEAAYRRTISSRLLNDLPERPRFVFCSTDLGFGVSWVFERTRVGSYRAGYLRPTEEPWTVARAVAASSCFPPVFRPLRLSFEPDELTGAKSKHLPAYADIIRHIRLSDGGVYDNLGLQPALSARVPTVLVSDGGAPFQRRAPRNPLAELLRYTNIFESQVGILRKSVLLGLFRDDKLEGAYWGIKSATTSFPSLQHVPGYSKETARLVARIRTDLDAFSPDEAAVLENHGYALAEAALRTHAARLVHPDALPFELPHPKYAADDVARQAIKGSDRRKLFGRRAHR